MSKFQHVLRNLRKNKNLSLEQLAENLNKLAADSKVKFSRTAISRWEQGEVSPSLDHAKVIAKYFKVTLDQLDGLEEIQEDNNMPETMAAHLDKDIELTDEQWQKVIMYAKFIKETEGK